MFQTFLIRATFQDGSRHGIIMMYIRAMSKLELLEFQTEPVDIFAFLRLGPFSYIWATESIIYKLITLRVVSHRVGVYRVCLAEPLIEPTNCTLMVTTRNVNLYIILSVAQYTKNGSSPNKERGKVSWFSFYKSPVLVFSRNL